MKAQHSVIAKFILHKCGRNFNKKKLEKVDLNLELNHKNQRTTKLV